MEKGELGVSGMVTNPSDRALLGKGVEIVICKSSYETSRAWDMSGHFTSDTNEVWKTYLRLHSFIR